MRQWPAPYACLPSSCPCHTGGLRLPAQLLRLPRTKTQISRGIGGGGGKGGVLKSTEYQESTA